MDAMCLRNVCLSPNYKVLQFRNRTFHSHPGKNLNSKKEFPKFSGRTNCLHSFSSVEGSCFCTFHNLPLNVHILRTTALSVNYKNRTPNVILQLEMWGSHEDYNEEASL
jgi:hypothetical protein